MKYEWKNGKKPHDPPHWFKIGENIKVEIWELHMGFRCNVNYRHRLMDSLDIPAPDTAKAKLAAEEFIDRIRRDFSENG